MMVATTVKELPYGTLLFNVIENGQPRWQALPTQIVDEGDNGNTQLASVPIRYR